jgi:glycosyltransferase involved in cell wall biosynthesis
MERMSSRIADQLIAVGETQKKQINASHWLPDSAIGVVRNGVQSAKIHYRNPDFRSKIGAENKILVGTIATMIPQKGLHDLLALARRVRDAIRNVHFVVVGEGVMRPDLERLRSQLGLENTVTFAGWIMNASSVALPEFDIYIQPSLWEAMSISILEAMAAGKPVIATQVGEASYMISHGSEGFLYAARDIEGMASGVLRLAENENLRRSMGVAAARKVADRFTVDHMTRAYETIYLNTMKKVIDRVT